MLFLGQSFFGDNTCSKLNPVDTNNIKSIKLGNGIYDNLYVSKYGNTNVTLEWDYNTVLYATFNDNLLAGNLGYSIDTITSIRIKKREKGKFKWTTIYDIPVHSIEDLEFVYNYYYCKGNTNYEFAMIPVLNNTIEGNLNVMECTSKFNGAYIVEKDVAVQMILNFQMNQQRNQNATILQTLGRQLPFYITNGVSNYDSGQINVTFIRMNDCDFDEKNSAQYRKTIDDILVDRKPKILKTDNGNMWLIAITDNIIQNDSGSIMPVHTINWTEIGDCEDDYDMYINGFHNFYLKE